MPGELSEIPETPAGRSPFDDFIGTEWIAADPEGARVRLRIADHHRQVIGLVHGGVLSTLVEGVCSWTTARTVWEQGMIAIGQSQSIQLLRPVRGEHVNVEARARHRGRTTWVWEAEVTDDEGNLCALSHMTIAVRPSRT